MTAVQARLHYAMKQEFKLLKIIIADYAPEEYDYEPVDGRRTARRSLTTTWLTSFQFPIQTPATMAQKIVQYQAVLQLAANSTATVRLTTSYIAR